MACAKSHVSQKQLFMIGGPNGAGKTTTSFSLMPEILQCDEYVNADAIAASLSPFKPATMASKTFHLLLKSCKQNGYQINLLYLWLTSPELSIERVKERNLMGGHSIPADVIKRRYYRSMYNFIHIYLPLADRWSVYDNSEFEPVLIVKKHQRFKNSEIRNKAIWKKITEAKL